MTTMQLEMPLTAPSETPREPVELVDGQWIACGALSRDALPCEHWAKVLFPQPGGFWIARCQKHKGRKA